MPPITKQRSRRDPTIKNSNNKEVGLRLCLKGKLGLPPEIETASYKSGFQEETKQFYLFSNEATIQLLPLLIGGVAPVSEHGGWVIYHVLYSIDHRGLISTKEKWGNKVYRSLHKAVSALWVNRSKSNAIFFGIRARKERYEFPSWE